MRYLKFDPDPSFYGLTSLFKLKIKLGNYATFFWGMENLAFSPTCLTEKSLYFSTKSCHTCYCLFFSVKINCKLKLFSIYDSLLFISISAGIHSQGMKGAVIPVAV